MIAPLTIALIGVTGTLVTIGAAVIAYSVFVLKQSDGVEHSLILAQTE